MAMGICHPPSLKLGNFSSILNYGITANMSLIYCPPEAEQAPAAAPSSQDSEPSTSQSHRCCMNRNSKGWEFTFHCWDADCERSRYASCAATPAPGALPLDFQISVPCTVIHLWWCLRSPARPRSLLPSPSPQLSLWLAVDTTGCISASLQKSHDWNLP